MFDFIDTIKRGHDIVERMQCQIDENAATIRKSDNELDFSLSLYESCIILQEACKYIVKTNGMLIDAAGVFFQIAEALDLCSEDSEESAEDAMDEEAPNEQSELEQARRIIDYSTKSVIAKKAKTTRSN